MKKIFYSCLMLTAGLFVASCEPDQDEFFKESAAERIEASIEKIEQTLESSPNGWEFELYSNGGGTSVLMNFKDGKVSVKDNLLNGMYGVDTPMESLYSVIQNGGPVLTLDTFNPIFHGYSDPVTPGKYVGDDEGLGADFEYVVESVTPDLIILRGLKHQRICRMKRMAEDVVWDDYLDVLDDMEDNMVAPMYAFYYNGQLVAGTNSLSNGYLQSYIVVAPTTEELDAESQLVSISVATLPTVDGFMTQEPFSYMVDDANPKIQHFTYDAENMRFVCTDEGVDMYIEKIYPPAPIAFANMDSQFKFNMSFATAEPYQNDMSESMAALFQAFHNSDCAPYGEMLYQVKMGAPETYAADFIVKFYSYSPAAGGSYISVFGYSVTPVEGTDDQVVFSNVSGLKYDNYYPSGYDVMNALVNNGPWTVTFDNEVAPNKYTFVSTTDSSMWFSIAYAW